jgi:hypothetical protein
MLQIPELVNYCDSSYARQEEKCATCTNEECEGACARCFNSIHKVGSTRDYDCPNLMYHYVCTYLYAYSSEIWHLFNYDIDLKNLDEYRVLSIGCGPTSELFGISKIANGKSIKYVGFDINTRWTDIHQKIKQIVDNEPNCTADLKIGNVFEEFESLDFEPNIIVMSYLVSHLSKAGIDVRVFMSDLKTKILDKLTQPYYIVINDINLNTARDKFPYIYQELNPSINKNVSCNCYSFDGYTYGTRHTSKGLIESIPGAILQKYQTWQHCKKTAQMLIKVN